MSITAANCSSPADASLRGAGGPGARMDLARWAGLGRFFLSRKLSLQTPRLRVEFANRSGLMKSLSGRGGPGSLSSTGGSGIFVTSQGR